MPIAPDRSGPADSGDANDAGAGMRSAVPVSMLTLLLLNIPLLAAFLIVAATQPAGSMLPQGAQSPATWTAGPTGPVVMTAPHSVPTPTATATSAPIATPTRTYPAGGG